MDDYQIPEESAPDWIHELYHENSKLCRWDVEFGMRTSALNASAEWAQLVQNSAKQYRGANEIKLPMPSLGNMRLWTALRERRSAEGFVHRRLSLLEASNLMFGCAGIMPTPRGPRRMAPSAGALYPIEAYLAMQGTDWATGAIYHYSGGGHSLELIRTLPDWEELTNTTSYPELVIEASAVLILSARFGRANIKYGERAYRFCLLEAGHIAQDVLLVATASGLAGVPLGGYYDGEVDDLVGLDGVEESVIYMIALGEAADTQHFTEMQSTIESLIVSSASETGVELTSPPASWTNHDES